MNYMTLIDLYFTQRPTQDKRHYSMTPKKWHYSVTPEMDKRHYSGSAAMVLWQVPNPLLPTRQPLRNNNAPLPPDRALPRPSTHPFIHTPPPLHPLVALLPRRPALQRQPQPPRPPRCRVPPLGLQPLLYAQVVSAGLRRGLLLPVPRSLPPPLAVPAA